MTDVFISYAREDRACAQRLADCLEARGISVWWDTKLIGGADYRSKIRQNIEEAGKVIVLWSAASANSGFVIDEATEARRLGKLVPLALDGARPPFGFGNIHTLAVGADIAADLEQIIAALRERPGQLPPREAPRRRAHTALAAAFAIAALLLAGGGYWVYWGGLLPAMHGGAASPQASRAQPAAAGARIALVMGNGNYRHLTPLANARRDAEAVSAALEKRGFKVIEIIDATHAEAIQAITDFENTLAVVGGTGLFYYAGSAAYIDGEDIMLPVDAREDQRQQAIVGGVNLTRLLAEIRGKTTARMQSRGSAVIYSASKGELASDGPPGGNSPFTSAFLRALDGDQDEVGEVFRSIRAAMAAQQQGGQTPVRQTPHLEDSRGVGFYFNRPERDSRDGIMKIVVFDSCRDNPFKLRVATQ